MNKTVFVGLSGGVDSSVAALRLIKQGYKVVGVFIKVWQPDFLVCNWEQERLDAMRVAAHLRIPFLTCDAEEEYKRDVGEYFISEYLKGRTPNPDVMCNRYVKFGAFLRFARKHKADFIATGHYARVAKIQNPNNKTQTYKLLRGVDNNKDQSYFLWTLTQSELKQVLLPVGDTIKEEIRWEAGVARLPTAVKKDSQGVCFLGQIDIPEFLSHFTQLKMGEVLDKSGNIIGQHKGALVYTLGQRHGFTVNTKSTVGEPHYVIGRDLDKNTITVDIKPPQIDKETSIQLDSVNWIAGMPGESKHIEAQFRYRQIPVPVTVNGNIVTPLTKIDKPSAGQSVVFYEGEECLGGGVVD